MQAFVDRFRYKASKARQAQSRLKAIEKLAMLPALTQAPDVVLRFPATKIPPPPLITLDRVRAGYGSTWCSTGWTCGSTLTTASRCSAPTATASRPLPSCSRARWRRMGGELVSAPKLRVGYFAQHQIEELEPGQSAVQHLARRLPSEREERLRTRLGGFGLSQDKADLPAARLSGGEKARLTFALMSALAPQILILDEPTNHLDVDSRDALVEAINDFAGAVILISHDRHLIELTADRLWLVADGRVRPFDGDIDSYRQGLLGRARGNGADEAQTQRPPARRRAAQRLAPLRQAARQASASSSGLTRDRSALAARLTSAATYRLPGAEIEALARRGADSRPRSPPPRRAGSRPQQALEQAQA